MKRLAFIILMALCVSVFGAEVYRLATDATVGNDFDTDGKWSAFPTGAVLYLPMSQSTNGYGVNYSPDFSGSGNDGTNNGATYSTEGGGSYDFDAPSDERINLPLFGIFDGSTDFSISTWVKPETLFDTSAVMSFRGERNLFYAFGNSVPTNQFTIRRQDGGAYGNPVTSHPVNLGQWCNILAVYDASVGWFLYVDGVLVDSAASPAESINANSSGSFIGGRTTLDDFDGLIDEVAIFPRLFTAQEARDAFALGTATHEPIPAFNNTVLYAPFNTNTTPTVDQSYYAMKNWPGNTGTVSGASWTSASEGYWFDGTNDSITVSDNSNVQFNGATEDFSIAAWIKLDVLGTADYVVDKRDASGDGYRFFINDAGLLFISVNSSSLNTGVGVVTDTNWHHVAVTCDRGIVDKLYLDGLQVGSGDISGQAMDTTVDLTIGSQSYTSGNVFAGNIDDVPIYSTALTSNQVYTLSQQAH